MSALNVLLSAAIVAVLVTPGMGGGAVTAGGFPRTATVDVVSDLGGAHKLNVTTELREAKTNCLVKVTNRLGDSVTVNVSLSDNSTDLGTLRVSLLDVIKSGDSVEFSLATGETQTVEMDVDDNTNGSVVYFNATATGSEVEAIAEDRNAPVRSSADTTCA